MSMASLAQTPQKVNIGQVLERLQGVHKTAKGWSARCPAHDDRSPSLSVAVSDDGRILLYCWAGCSFSEIVAALGFQHGDLSPGRPRPRTPEEHRAAAERDRQRVLERALECWAQTAYIKLVPLRRACFLMLDEPDSYYSTLMDYCDHVLDELQYGDKQSVQDACKARALGLPGMVIVA